MGLNEVWALKSKRPITMTPLVYKTDSGEFVLLSNHNINVRPQNLKAIEWPKDRGNHFKIYPYALKNEQQYFVESHDQMKRKLTRLLTEKRKFFEENPFLALHFLEHGISEKSYWLVIYFISLCQKKMGSRLFPRWEKQTLNAFMDLEHFPQKFLIKQKYSPLGTKVFRGEEDSFSFSVAQKVQKEHDTPFKTEKPSFPAEFKILSMKKYSLLKHIEKYEKIFEDIKSKPHWTELDTFMAEGRLKIAVKLQAFLGGSLPEGEIEDLFTFQSLQKHLSFYDLKKIITLLRELNREDLSLKFSEQAIEFYSIQNEVDKAFKIIS